MIGNHLEGLEGDGARSAITLQNGVQDTPLNGYSQVRRALIASNTVVDCRHTLLIGLADEDKFRAALPPADCRFERNRISGRPGVPVVTLENGPLNSQWRENEFFGGSLGMPPVAGVAFVEQKLVRETSGLHRFENAPAPAVPLTRAQAGPAWSRSQTGNGTHP